MINFARKYYHVLTITVLASLIAACGSDEHHLTSTDDPDIIYNHSVAFRNHTTFTWGANSYGQLGNGDDDSSNNQYTPVQVVGVDKVGFLTGMAGVSAGATHILAFNNSPGNVYAWGNNGDGQLGNNLEKSTSSPVQVIIASNLAPLSGVIAVSAGGGHSLALKSDGTVWAWGSNDDEKLGVTTADNPQRTAVQITSLTTPVTKVAAAGGGHSLALMSDKTVMSWGRNTSGQLGRTTATTATPGTVVKVTGNLTSDLTNVTDIAAGRSHSLFLVDDGVNPATVWACGYNFVGQLGDGSNTNSVDHAVQVLKSPGVPFTGVKAVAAGMDHSLALMNDKTVWAWGLNNYGQLGNGKPLTGSEVQTSTFPVQVFTNATTPLTGIDKVVAIGNHNLAVDENGQLWAWGYNSFGQLGLEDDDATNRNYATKVPDLSTNSGL